MDVQAIVGDENRVQSGRTRLAVIAAENAQQDSILAREDLLEPVQLKAGRHESDGLLRAY
jgi:hypothetical protein